MCINHFLLDLRIKCSLSIYMHNLTGRYNTFSMEKPVIIFMIISSSVLDSELTFMCQFISHNQMHVMYLQLHKYRNIIIYVKLENTACIFTP